MTTNLIKLNPILLIVVFYVFISFISCTKNYFELMVLVELIRYVFRNLLKKNILGWKNVSELNCFG